MAEQTPGQEAQRRIAKAQRGKAVNLDLSGLGLTSLPDSLGQLTQLTTLDLSNNGLTSLPDFFGQLPQLSRVDLTGNDLTPPPPKVITQGTHAILLAYRTLETHVETWANGDRYEGEWKDSKRNGQGVFTWADGDRYEGAYVDNKRSGQGVSTFANGDRYEGEWKDDNQNGQGVSTFASGNRYEGAYVDSKRNGQGVFTFANGDRYEGAYVDGKRNGQGVFTWADGDRYEGEWKNDKWIGQGLYFKSRLQVILKWSIVVIIMISSGASVITYISARVWVNLPNGKETRQMSQSVHINVEKYSHDEKTQVELIGSRFEYDLNIQLENISDYFVKAVISSEDRHFYDHGDMYKVAKFTQAVLKCVLKRFHNCPGNSTIPQQLARNLFIGEIRGPLRKFKELLWAMKMERTLTKEEILKSYLNRINLGQRSYGVELAARAYLGKSAKDLDLYESVVLAAAIKSPRWNWRQNPKAVIKRARILLSVMQREEHITAQQARFPTNFQPHRGRKRLVKPYFGHFFQWVQPQLQHILATLPDGQYKVITTLDAEAQIYAEKHLREHVVRQQQRGIPVSQGALVAIRPNNGAVIVMVGGAGNTLRARGINRAKATQGLAPRPPASSFKPIIYLAALEKKLKPNSIINAHPVRIPMNGNEQPYAPQNVDGKYYETVSLSTGLVKSINTAAVRLLYEHLTVEAIRELAERLGIQPKWLTAEWGLALGSSGVPLIEMATAYSVFANGGYAVEPYGLIAIYDEDGNKVWHRSSRSGTRVVAEQHIRDLNTMLAQVVQHGTGKKAGQGFRLQRTIAGKTGTGDEFVDAWFIGYTADIVTGVWLGNDKPTSMPGLYGGMAPAEIWNAFMHDTIAYTSLHPTKNPTKLRPLP